MRRLIAAFALLSFANLAFVQVDCPLSRGSARDAHVGMSHSAHGAHGMHAGATSATQESVQSVPEDVTPNAPECPMMGPCAITLEVNGIAVAAAPVPNANGVAAHSDQFPASLTLVPEPPPPKA